MNWIRVEESLPRIEQKVLVFDSKNPEVNIGYYDPICETESGWRCDEYMDISVTHWMPMPLPPESRDKSAFPESPMFLGES